MRHRLFQRLFAMLGMLAILAALVAVPASATNVSAMTTGQKSATSGDLSMAALADEMPCHKTAKHCPNCPQKVCPELGSCLIKCFQSFFEPSAGAPFRAPMIAMRVVPAPSQAGGGFSCPPTPATSERLNHADRRECGCG